MNQGGQAYSAFKLLIAAIIAVAILYILISIIGGIPLIGSDVPTVSKQMIQKQVDMPRALDTSTSLVFKAGTNLAPSALTGNSGLGADQICLHKGDLVGNEVLEVKGKTIMHTGTSNLQVKVSVICDSSNTMPATLEEIGFDLDFDDESCACPLGEESTKKCCIVMLRFA